MACRWQPAQKVYNWRMDEIYSRLVLTVHPGGAIQPDVPLVDTTSAGRVCFDAYTPDALMRFLLSVQETANEQNRPVQVVVLINNIVAQKALDDTRRLTT